MVTVTMCVSGAALVKAGVDRSTALNTLTVGSDMAVELWIAEGESMVNTLCRTNFTDLYSTLNDDVKYILQDAVSSYAAIKAIMYDMSGYESRTIAEDLINVNDNNFKRCISILNVADNRGFIDAA